VVAFPAADVVIAALLAGATALLIGAARRRGLGWRDDQESQRSPKRERRDD